MIAENHRTPPAAYRIHFAADRKRGSRHELRREVASALEHGARRIIVDCASWSHFDLILLSALVNCAESCEERGADFELENLDRDVLSRIEALRLGDRLRVHADRP